SPLRPQTIAEVRDLLRRYGLSPRHSLGQNFLHDANKLRQILELAAIQPGERILEVGPGTGVLTELMLEAGARVLAVELDRDLEPLLRERLARYGDRFELMITDVLAGKHAIHRDVVERLSDEPFQLVANLPYQIASPLLAELATHHPSCTRGLAMVQREVADRLTAEPGSKQYGPLTINIRAQCHVRRVMTLKPGCFFPPPSVDSAVVELTRRDAPLTDDPDRLAAFVHKLFSKRRKQLGAILGRDRDWPQGVEPTMRPEQLDIATLAALAQQER
ncbi:MAG: 16S rRNA (adenine(1518)-N(6)/adenine(1519)-N(6))-dimethyltransferase RsmA, partial [Phycisphaeraceae bacterium]